MKIIIPVIGLIPVIILAVLGLLIKYKKAYWLISGYNTMSEEKKKNVDIEKLGKLMANFCFILAAIFLAAFIFLFLGKTTVFGILMALLIPVIIYILIYAQRFDGNNYTADGKMKTGVKVLIGSIIAFLTLVAIGVGILMYSSSKPVSYALENGSLNISGMYGQKVLVSSIKSIELKESMPEVLFKSNGSALGSRLKGYFKLKDIGQAKLFVDTSKPPFIFINTDTGIIILNCEESGETKVLYESLTAAVK